MEKRNITLWGMLLLACMTVSQSFAQVTVNMPFNTGVNQTFTVAPPGTCSFNFFDNGGAAANYSNGSNNTTAVTFAPSVATNKIQAVFSAFSVESGWDALYVYDGGSTASPLISSGLGATAAGFPAGGWQGTTAPNNFAANTVRATAGNATGRLTFTFGSDGSVSSAGWAAAVAEAPAGACAMTAPANVAAATGAGATACAAASVTVPTPAFNPAGCNSAFSLQYRINGGAAVVIGAVVPATITLTNVAVGVNTITWQLVTTCGGTIVSSVTSTVTVTDTTPPVVSCPSNITINLGPGECSALYSYNVSVSDNCAGVSKGYFAIPDTNIAINNNSVACFGLPVNAFQVLTGFATNVITSAVRVGIVQGWPGGSSAAATLTVNLYKLNNPALPYNVTAANRTLLGSSAVTPVAPTTAGQMKTIPISVNIPAGTTVLMEVASSSSFVIAMPPASGTNTWFASDACGYPSANPTLMINLGIGGYDMKAILYASSPVTGVQTSGLPSGSEFPIGTTTNCFKATDASGLTATCCFNVTVNEYPNAITSLICNDLIYFSIDEDCDACIGADQVLEGGPYGCYDNYVVELDKTAPFGNGPWVPGCVGLSDVGKTYQVRITDPKTGNKCWGNIKIEDKLAPKLTCCDVTIPCNASTAPTFSASNAVGTGKGNVPVAILDNQTVASSFNFTACNGATIQDVNVKLNITHTWVGDMRVTLESPTGTQVVLWANNCGPADNLIATFDDEAATCSNACADYASGQTLRPIGCLGAGAGTTDLLSKFDGQNPAGTWKLTVNDNTGGDQGTINAFEVQISYLTGPGGTVPAPEVDENCQLVNLTYIDSEVNGGCAQGFYKRIVRKWTGTDEYGNTGTCIQNINLAIPTLNDLTLPPDYDGIDAPFFHCTDNAYPTPQWIEGQGLQGWPYVSGLPVGCTINWNYEDLVIDVCDGTYKIRRAWTIIDWCIGDGFEYNQIIKVVDDQGPSITCPANLTVSTDPFQCCATVNLPDVIIEDNCSRINNISGMVTTFEPYTGEQTGMYPIGGSLTTFPGNNFWDLDTLGAFGTTTCLPVGTHIVTYVAEDDCGNTSSCTFRLTVRDYQPPVAACDQYTVVAIGTDDPFDCYEPANGCSGAGVTWVKASTFDDGSYDNCNSLKFRVQRMAPYSECINGLNAVNGHPDCADIFPDFPTEFERAINESDSIKFYCCEVGTTQTVVFRAYQVDVNGNIMVGPDGSPIVNECMVNVEVQDKIKPVCQPPANVTVACENFDASLWVYGKASVYDNCCLDTTKVYQGQCGLTHTVNYNLFDSLCNKGTITRTFKAYDCHGLTSQCTQRVVVTYNQDYYVRFPNDVIVTVCDGTGNYGEPTFFGEDCELLGVSYEDQVFTVVPDACFKIERVWTIINWCTYNPNLPCIDVPNPNPNPITNNPANLPGPIVSRAGTLAPWAPTVVKINPTDATATNYSTFWNKDANCYRYKQIIKVIDTQDPTIENCPASPVTFCDVTPNDPLLWNEMYWWDNVIGQHDLCEGPTDLTITATDACSGSNINIRYLLFLDLDGDGIMETVINSVNTGIAGLGWNNVPFNNYQSPNYSGGISRAFDGRPVPFNQKYGFAIQNTTSGTKKTASVRWNTQQSQNNFVIPELPYGTHKIKWFVEDGCGNESICEYTFIVKDCKKPTVVCLNGLSVNIMPTQMIQLWASDFLKYTEDNCTPANQLKIGIRKSDTGTGFPVDGNGNPITNVTFTCDELGTQQVELWSIDKAGNADFCETYVIVQDNNGNCPNLNAAKVAGALATEGTNGVEDGSVQISGSSNAVPTFTFTTMTDNTGAYNFNAIPLASNSTVTPAKDDNPLNGVSTYDLVLISKHILGIEPLNSPYKMIAADANKSNSITTFDIVELRKLILGIYSELPANTSWRHVDKSFVFPNPANPFQTQFAENKSIVNLNANQLGEDFVSVKVGDVNGTAIANSLMSSDDRTAGTLLFDVNDQTVKAGETFTMNFKAAEKVQGYQFTMNFAGLEVVDVVPGAGMKTDNFGVFADAITTSFDGDVQGEFAVTFRAAKAGKVSDMVSVSSRITKAEAYNNGARQDVAFRFNNGGVQTISGVGFELYQNQPNPFVNKTFIGFHLPEATAATLSIYDETGRMVFTQNGNFAKGYNSIAIDRALLNTTGMLYYKLETATDSATKKMIQSK